MEETFKDIREKYEALREQQRLELAAYLKSHKGLRDAGLSVVTAGTAGKGCKCYTGHGTIPEFDLQNWKWVELRGKDAFSAVISLNMPEVDPETGNMHALYDRVGVIFSDTEKVYTAIDLPLEDSEKEQIAQLVLDHVKAKRN